MQEKILLKCLIKDASTHRAIKALKSNGGEVDLETLGSELGISRNDVFIILRNLCPSVIENNSKIKISKDYEFLIVGKKGLASYYSNRCIKYNSRFDSKSGLDGYEETDGMF